MKYTLLAISIVCASQTVTAQQIFKCTAPNGTVVFSQHECGADAKVVGTIDAKSRSLEAKAGSDAIGDISNSAAFARIDSDCSIQLNNITRSYDDQISDLQAQVARLHRSMDYSYNNLAGATRDSGIATQISGLEGRIAVLEATRDSQYSAAQAQCSAKRDAEQARQETARERKMRAAADNAPAKVDTVPKSDSGD